MTYLDSDGFVHALPAPEPKAPLHETIIAFVIVIMILGGATYGIYALVSWIVTPTPQLTYAQSYREGWENGESDLGYNQVPWGKYSCVTDWNGEITGQPSNASFSNGGPVSNHLITYQDQNTGTRIGNAWMAGCTAALKSEGQ